MPTSKLLDALQCAIEKLPRWEVVSLTEGGIEATRKTALFRFTDDITIRVEDIDDGSQAVISSGSRIGKGDLGQNPRNIKALLEAVEEELSTDSQTT